MSPKPADLLISLRFIGFIVFANLVCSAGDQKLSVNELGLDNVVLAVLINSEPKIEILFRVFFFQEVSKKFP